MYALLLKILELWERVSDRDEERSSLSRERDLDLSLSSFMAWALR